MTPNIDGCLKRAVEALETVLQEHDRYTKTGKKAHTALADLKALMDETRKLAESDEINNDRHCSGNKEVAAAGVRGFQSNLFARSRLLHRAMEE